MVQTNISVTALAPATQESTAQFVSILITRLLMLLMFPAINGFNLLILKNIHFDILTNIHDYGNLELVNHSLLQNVNMI